MYDVRQFYFCPKSKGMLDGWPRNQWDFLKGFLPWSKAFYVYVKYIPIRWEYLQCYRTKQTNSQQSESLCGTFAASVVSELTQLTDGQLMVQAPIWLILKFSVAPKSFW